MAKVTWTVEGKKIPLKPKTFPGIPPVGELRSAYVKEFIARNKLVPAKQEIHIDEMKVTQIPTWWKIGGPWGPHLHLGDDIYLLNNAQWKDFSQGLIQEMNLKIKGAGVVKFETVMQAILETELAKGAK
jgi:hypothetical protein